MRRGIYVGDEAVALISSVIILDVYKASASAYQRNLGGRIRGASKMDKTFPQLSSSPAPSSRLRNGIMYSVRVTIHNRINSFLEAPKEDPVSIYATSCPFPHLPTPMRHAVCIPCGLHWASICSVHIQIRPSPLFQVRVCIPIEVG